VCRTVWCGFVGVSLCCVWYRLVWVWGSDCVLCLVQFGVGLWERVFVVCGKVWCGFVGLWESMCWTVWSGFVGVSVCCVWESLVWV